MGSFILQTHLSYGLLVPALGAWAVLGLVVGLDRRRRRDPGPWPGLRRRALRAAAVASLVLAACWAQPLVEQFTSDGPGNLTRLAYIDDPVLGTIGYGRGARILATVVCVPPCCLRLSFSNAKGLGRFPHPPWPPPRCRCWRFPHPPWPPPRCRCWLLCSPGARAMRAIAGIGRFSTWWRPRPSSSLADWPRQDEFLSGTSASRWASTDGCGRSPRSRPSPSGRHSSAYSPGTGAVGALVGAFAVATVVIAALNLPTSDQGIAEQTESFPAVRELDRQMARLEDEGTVLVRVSASFDIPDGMAVMAELPRRGVPFVVDDEALVRQLGPDPRFTGSNARALLLVVTGDATGVAPRVARRGVMFQGLSAQEQLELSALETRIEEYVAEDRVRVDRRGQAELERLVAARGGSAGQGDDPERVLTPREVAGLGQAGFLVAGDEWGQRFERYADLHDRRDDSKVALFLQPLGDRTRPAQ